MQGYSIVLVYHHHVHGRKINRYLVGQFVYEVTTLTPLLQNHPQEVLVIAVNHPKHVQIFLKK